MADRYETWLDAHQLVPGDDLPGKISDALAKAGAFVVVISSSSLASKWLPYELRLATQRMIQGELRVVPVRLESVEMPPEVRSLLYADFTQDFDEGFVLVRKALEQEAAKFAQAREEQYLYLEVDRLVQEEFDGVAMVSHGRAYQSLDYSAAVMDLSDGRTLEIPLETIDAYDGPPSPLGSTWLSEFCDAEISQVEPFTLVVSRRPLGFEARALDATDARVRVVSEHAPNGRHLRTIYFVDVSPGLVKHEHRALLAHVREDIERRELERRGSR